MTTANTSRDAAIAIAARSTDKESAEAMRVAALAAIANVRTLANIDRFEADDAERFAEMTMLGVTDFFELRFIAQVYTIGYTGNFSYMVDMQQALRRWSKLTNGQAKGVLNCMVAELKRSEVNKASAAAPIVNTSEQPTSATVPVGTYTIGNDDDYVTLKVTTTNFGNFPEGTKTVKFLNGADNENSYKGFAFIMPNGTVKVWNAFKSNSRIANALNALVSGDFKAFGYAYALQSGNCYRCNRKLTTPASINLGLGPICADMV